MTFLPILAAVALTAGPVSLQYEGPLKDALKEIAQKGGLNVVVAAPLNEQVQVHLKDVSAEEALETVAKVYSLEVTKQGKLWVIRSTSPAPKAESTAPLSGVAAPAVPAVPPVPPVPPIVPPGLPPLGDPEAALDPDALREHADRVREEAERAREEAEALREALREQADEARERARELADAQREEAQALREHAQAQAEVARAHAEVARQRVGAGGPVRIEAGTVVDSAVAYGGPVIVEAGAVVDGDAVAFGGDVVLEAGAVVKGDAVSFGGSVVKNEGAVVEGDSVNFGGAGIGSAMARSMVKREKATRAVESGSSSGPSFGTRFAGFLLEFAVLFGLGFLMMMFAPQRMKAIEDNVRREPVKNGLAGFLGLLAAVPATLILVVTLVGIPVAIFLWPAIVFFSAVGLVAVANRLGVALPSGRLRKTQALALALGILALMLVSLIPVLGKIVLIIAALIGFGAIIRTRFGQPTRGTPIFDSAGSTPIAT
ncbi:MAG: hypothetical protein AB1938_02735 [Myxococcota bacterium]